MHPAARLESLKCLDVLFEIVHIVRVIINVSALEERIELES